MTWPRFSAGRRVLRDYRGCLGRLERRARRESWPPNQTSPLPKCQPGLP